MALVRVYLATYRRPRTLERALCSLRAQSMTDWICELHNDDPSDDAPAKLAERINDRRIVYIRHERNLGPTVAFNTFHRTVDEPYFSLLEDDNWWEPDFLARTVDVLGRHHDAQLAWANMRRWNEEDDGSWTDTGCAIWEVKDSQEPIKLRWPQLAQMAGALHSNGAMLVRSHGAERHRIPESTPFAVIEPVRERTFHTVVFLPEVLANFAVTRTSARRESRAEWEQVRFLLTRSFFDHVPLSPSAHRRVWREWRRPPRATATLFLVALSRLRHLPLLGSAGPADWLAFARFAIARPGLLYRILRAPRECEELWQFLDRETALRWHEARAGEGSAEKVTACLDRPAQLELSKGC